MDYLNVNYKARNSYLLLIILICLIVYLNGLNAGFLAIDDPNFLNYVKSQHISLKELFLPTAFDRYYRPLFLASFIFNFLLFAYNSAAFHLINILMHLSNAILVYFVALEISRKYENSEQIALLSSLVFALHPLNSEAVLWISAWADLLCCFFFLLFVLLLMKNRSNLKPISLVCLLIFYICSLLSKESGIMILPFSLVYLLAERKSITVKDSISMVAVLIIGTACYFYLRNGMNAENDSGLTKLMSNEQSVLDCFVSDLTACGFYIRKMLFPFPLNFAITNIAMPINLIVSCMGLPFLLFLYNKSEALHIPILVMLSGLIQPLLALNGKMSWTPYAERYIYMSMTGFSVLVGFSLRYYARKVPFSVLLAGSLLISIPTMYRVAEWTDPIKFWQDTALKSPRLATVRLLLAEELMDAGRYNEAEKQLASAESIGLRRYVDRIRYEELITALKKNLNP